MKVVIFAAAGLVAGLGGGTAWRALQVKTEVEARYIAAADSAAAALADSLAAAHAASAPDEGGAHDGGVHESAADPGHESGTEGAHDADPGQVEVAGGASGEAGAGDEEAAVGEAQAEEEEGAGGGPDATGEEEAAAPESQASQADDGPAGTEEGARRLARVFSAMRPNDAARVLAELSDPEVEAILLRLGDRQAGQILSTFPAERAAVLSRRVLGREGGQE